MKIHWHTFLLLHLCLVLGACSGMQLVSVGTQVVSGKGLADHALSIATGDDCNTLNLIYEERICDNFNSAQMHLLTNGRSIDDQLLTLSSIKGERFLIIGSFSEQQNAEDFLASYGQWSGRIIAFDGALFRVGLGPLKAAQIASMKVELEQLGVGSAWVMSL